MHRHDHWLLSSVAVNVFTHERAAKTQSRRLPQLGRSSSTAHWPYSVVACVIPYKSGFMTHLATNLRMLPNRKRSPRFFFFLFPIFGLVTTYYVSVARLRQGAVHWNAPIMFEKSRMPWSHTVMILRWVSLVLMESFTDVRAKLVEFGKTSRRRWNAALRRDCGAVVSQMHIQSMNVTTPWEGGIRAMTHALKIEATFFRVIMILRAH